MTRLTGQNLDRCVRECALGQGACDSLPGRGAAGADDAPSGMPSLESEPVVELDARVDEVDDPRRCVLCQGSHGAQAAETAAGPKRVFGVKRRRVVGPGRGRDSSLGEPARRGEDGTLRDDRDTGLPGGCQGGGQTGDSRADDDQVVGAVAHQRCAAW